MSYFFPPRLLFFLQRIIMTERIEVQRQYRIPYRCFNARTHKGAKKVDIVFARR